MTRAVDDSVTHKALSVSGVKKSRLSIAVATTLIVVLGMLPNAAPAQARPAQYDYWTVVLAAQRETGPLTNLSRTNAAAITRLASALLDRGQFFLDLYELDRVLVRDHARMRDSISRAGGAQSPAAAYYLGRALQELGANREAGAAYRRVGPKASVRTRSNSSAWQATLVAGGARSWQQDLTNWRDGKAVANGDCPSGESLCSLFRAILANDIAKIALLQGELMATANAEHKETLTADGGTFSVEYHDPLQHLLLGMADFALALHVAQGQDTLALVRGIALLRLGRWKDAEATLSPLMRAGGATAAEVAVYLGEAQFRAGNRAGADQHWKSATGPARNRLADIRTGLGIDATIAQTQFRSAQASGLRNLAEGRGNSVSLVRALLRAKEPRSALTLLEQVRPISLAADLARVRPEVLVLAARARYDRGREPGFRDNLPLAQEELAALARNLVVIRPTLRLMQEINVPFGVSNVRGPN